MSESTKAVRRRVMQQRNLLPRDQSSSSSMAEDDESLQKSGSRSISTSSNHSVDATGQPRRRKKRKRNDGKVKDAGRDQRALKEKIGQLELALISFNATSDGSSSGANSDQDGKADEPFYVGKERLKELAISEGGLVNDEMRKKVWPRLVDIDLLETDILPTDEELKANKNYNQVVMDVNRSLKRFPPGISDDERPELQDQLTRLIIRVLARHPDLFYYQGYHDVAITFLLVVGEEMAFQIMERLSTGPWLRDFMEPTMERTNYLLQFMYPIIDTEDPQLCSFLEESEVGTVFALPWLITWFGHVLPNYSDVVRLYDFFLAQPPMMPVYLAAAIVLHRKKDILNTECDLASMHGLLARIPLDNPPFEKLLVKARDLYDSCPPAEIEKDVEARMEKIKQAMLLQVSSAKARHLISRKVTKDHGGRSLVKRLIFVAAPVLISVMVYKYVQGQSFF